MTWNVAILLTGILALAALAINEIKIPKKLGIVLGVIIWVILMGIGLN